MSTTLPGDVSPWTRHVRGHTHFRNRDDCLHAWYLGFFKDFCGQLLFDFACDLCRKGEAGCLDDAMHALWIECVAWWQPRGSINLSSKPFTLTTVQWSSYFDYPVIEAKMKGATCKQLFFWLADRQIQMVQDGEDASAYAATKAGAAWHLKQVVDICDDGGVFLEPAQATLFRQHGEEFLLRYQSLAYDAIVAQTRAWKLRPKLHYFAHTCLEVEWTLENPRRLFR